MLVDRVEAGQELAEHVGTQGDRERQPDRRVDGITSAHPVPEAEGVRRVDAERCDLVERGRHGDEVVGHGVGAGGIRVVDRALLGELRPQPVASQAGVGQGLERREGLRGDDEEGGLGIEVSRLLRDVGGVDIRDEAGVDAGVGVRQQSLVDHHRAQVAAADADVDDVRDLLAGDAAPLARAHAVGEGAQPVEHLVHVVVDLLTVDDEGRLDFCRATERGVQHRAVLTGVQVRTAQHRAETIAHTGLVGEGDQSVEDLGGDEVLGQVDVQVAHRAREITRAIGVGGEPATQVGIETLPQSGEAGPGGGGGGIDRRSHGTHASDLGRSPRRG